MITETTVHRLTMGECAVPVTGNEQAQGNLTTGGGMDPSWVTMCLLSGLGLEVFALCMR